MGSSETQPDADSDEFPQHTVYLDAYKIGRYEVTNQQHNRCIRAGVCSKPSSIVDEPEKEDHPVVYVTWGDAQVFCAWNGGRLPTEAEWEKAARGGLEGALYTWGDDSPDCSLANYNGNTCIGDTSPVGSYNNNGYGLYDMAGNVWEWTADWYDSEYYTNSPTNNPQGPENGDFRVLRGGSWGSSSYFLRAAYRYDDLPDYAGSYIGFRCARSP